MKTDYKKMFIDGWGDEEKKGHQKWINEMLKKRAGPKLLEEQK